MRASYNRVTCEGRQLAITQVAITQVAITQVAITQVAITQVRGPSPSPCNHASRNHASSWSLPLSLQSRKSQSRKFVAPSTQHTFILFRLLQGLRRAYQAQRGSRNSRAALLCTRGIPASLSRRSVQGFGLGFRSVSGMSPSSLGLRIEGLRFVVYLLFVCCLSVL